MIEALLICILAPIAVVTVLWFVVLVAAAVGIVLEMR